MKCMDGDCKAIAKRFVVRKPHAREYGEKYRCFCRQHWDRCDSQSMRKENYEEIPFPGWLVVQVMDS
jgi:hypothetical protein